MKTSPILYLPVLLGLLAVGCVPSRSSAPIGQKPAVIKAEDWNGSWRGPGSQQFKVHVLDATEGALRFAWLDVDSNQIQVNQRELLLRAEGSAILFNFWDATDNPRWYQVGRVVNTGQSITAWGFRPDALRPLVDAGSVKASFSTNQSRVEVEITGGFDRLARELAGPQGWLLLDLENPLVFIKEP